MSDTVTLINTRLKPTIKTLEKRTSQRTLESSMLMDSRTLTCWLVGFLASQHFGVPQHRERVFIHCFTGGRGRALFPFTEGQRNVKKCDYGKKSFVSSTISSKEGKRWGSTLIARAVLTPGQDLHGVEVGDRIRRLTPIECERLQGFPDDWTKGVSEAQRYKQLGNAVTVNVIEALGRALTA